MNYFFMMSLAGSLLPGFGSPWMPFSPTGPAKVGMLVPLDASLGQAIMQQRGTTAVVLRAVGAADFSYHNVPQYLDLVGAELSMSLPRQASLTEVVYFSVQLPPQTRLSNFQLVQHWPRLWNTGLGTYGAYAEVVADTNVKDDSALKALARQYRAKLARAGSRGSGSQRGSHHAAKQQAVVSSSAKHRVARKSSPPYLRVASTAKPPTSFSHQHGGKPTSLPVSHRAKR